MPSPPAEPYEFGPFRLEIAERRLTRDAALVPLTPKVFDTLVLLVERAGHLVTKGELMAALWGDMVVEEANLTKNIWLLRKALREDEDTDSPCIETVPKVGYRWVAPVRRVLVPAPAPASTGTVQDAAKATVVSSPEPMSEAPPSPRFGRAAAAAGVVLVSLAAAALVVR
jgi:DNA-binding winged helix-turn-helix (wHTH) protein